MIDETALYITRLHPRSRVGILATTGTLRRRLFHDRLKRHGHTPLSLFDVDKGESLQRSYVMEAIYGPWQGDHFGCGGIKSCGPNGGIRFSCVKRQTFLSTGCTSMFLLQDAPKYRLRSPIPKSGGFHWSIRWEYWHVQQSGGLSGSYRSAGSRIAKKRWSSSAMGRCPELETT